MKNNKKWVFDALVKNSNDPKQLLAYAFYKADKDDTAISMRGNGKSEEEIKIALANFHDTTAVSSRKLDRYRTLADDMIKAMVQNIASTAEDESKNLVKVEVKKAIDLYHKKVKQDAYKEESKGRRFLNFTISGLSGLWVTFLVMSLLFAASMYAADETDRSKIVDSFGNKIKNTMTSNPFGNSDANADKKP